MAYSLLEILIMSEFNDDLTKIALLREKRKVKQNDNKRPVTTTKSGEKDI